MPILKTEFHEIDGHKVRVAEMGNGEPIIFMHGYPDNLQIWSNLAPLLAQKYRVIAFDWPGTGCSEEWSGGATPMHMAEKLKALMDAWKIQTAHLVGLDMCGQPPLVFAGRHPDRVKKLVVMNCLAFGDEKTSLDIAILRKFGLNRLILRNLPTIVFARALHSFLPFGVPVENDVKSDMWESFKQPHVRSYISKMCAGYQGTLPKLPEIYRQIQCPVLILWAELDKHFPLAQALRLNEVLKDAKLEIVSKGEHWIAYYRAQEIADSILRFLS